MQNAFCTNFQRIYWYFSLHSDFFCFRMLSSSKKAFFILQSGSCSYQNDPAAFCSLPGTPGQKEKIPPHSPEASEYHGPTPYDP